jgi:hypothetical protein
MTSTRTTIRDAALGAAAAAIAILGTQVMTHDTPDPKPHTITTYLPACHNEDGGGSLPCLWDGTTRGNGKGRTFIMNADLTITYLT